jgi:hypothetical protein
MKSGDTVMKSVTGVIIIKAILFALLCNMSRLLPFNGHGMNNRSPKIIFI